MAITSLDQILAGARPPVTIMKDFTPGNNGNLRFTSLLRVGGGWPRSPNLYPGPPSAGGIMTGSVSDIRRSNPPAGQNAYLSRFALCSNVGGMVILLDRLWRGAWTAPTEIGPIAVTSAATNPLPPRDDNGTTAGDGVLALIESTSAFGAASCTYTLNVTASDGTTGHTITRAFNASEPANTARLFDLPAGKKGIRSIQTIQRDVSQVSGNLELVLYRPIATLLLEANGGGAIDALTGALPRIYDNSALSMLFMQTDSPIWTNLFGTYAETWG